MSKPKSPELLAAIEAVRLGMVPFRAAKLHNVLPSTLSRALNRKPAYRCECGQKLPIKSLFCHACGVKRTDT